jgi:hypothetical protein
MQVLDLALKKSARSISNKKAVKTGIERVLNQKNHFD